MNIRKNKKWLADAILLLISIAFVSYYCHTTSPLFQGYDGEDSSFFRLVGQGMTKGLLPYRDFFDMKGPWLFFIEYLGQLINYGKNGIFILECLNLWVCLLLLRRIFDIYGIHNYVLQLFMIAMWLCYSCVTFWGGNETEEWSLIPLLSCLYLCLTFFRDVRQGEVSHCPLYSFWYGICFGFLVFVRIINAALIGAIVIVISAHLLEKRSIRNLFINLTGFLFGMICSIMPMLIFYYTNHLLHELWENVFMLGYRYAEEGTFIHHIERACNWNILMLVLPIISTFLMGRDFQKEKLLIIIGSLFTFAVIVIGTAHIHYYSLCLPLITMGEVGLVKTFKDNAKMNRKRGLAICLALLMLISQARDVRANTITNARWMKNPDMYHHRENAQTLAEHITSDRDSVYGYSISSNWFTYTDLFPCNRFCFWQNHYLLLIPDLQNEFEAFFQNDPPIWLIVSASHEAIPALLQEEIKNNYELVAMNEEHTLYHHLIEKD